MIDLSRDIHPLTDFKRKTSEFVKQLKETGAPVVLTVNGKAELVVQDAAAYQRLLELVEQLETVQTLRRRLASARRGEGRLVDEFFDGLAEKHTGQRRSVSERAREPPDMSDPRLSTEEVAERGKALYEEGIRAQVETEENIGKIVAIDVETGAYEIGDDLLGPADRLHCRRPGAPLWSERIGYDAVYALSGSTLTRTAP